VGMGLGELGSQRHNDYLDRLAPARMGQEQFGGAKIHDGRLLLIDPNVCRWDLRSVVIDTGL
jgi:hypothetical protein